ncbi:MAG: 30S ribosomal protein S8e [Nitrososphaerales archaeon]
MSKSVENLTKRKASGGRRKAYRGRRAYEIDRYALEPILGPQQTVKRKVRGGNFKVGFKRVEYANVTNLDKRTTKKVKILKVLSNPANREYERRGVITKGAIIETEMGKAKVTSRPSQDGVVNAILIS